jgi:hypothetical protein
VASDAIVRTVGKTYRGKPTQAPEGQETEFVRQFRYNEQAVVPIGSDDENLAQEGSEFVAGSARVFGTPTDTIQPGTGLATIAAQASFADTAPFLLIKNTAPAGSGIRIALKYVKLINTAIGTAGASIRWASKLDDVNPLRYTSGGSKLVPINVNMDDNSPSYTDIYAGALVAIAATGSARGPFGNAILRPVIPVVADTYLITFGRNDSPVGGLIPSGATISDRVVNSPSAIIGPQQWYAGHLWLPSQSAASSWEVEVKFSVR